MELPHPCLLNARRRHVQRLTSVVVRRSGFLAIAGGFEHAAQAVGGGAQLAAHRRGIASHRSSSGNGIAGLVMEVTIECGIVAPDQCTQRIVWPNIILWICIACERTDPRVEKGARQIAYDSGDSILNGGVRQGARHLVRGTLRIGRAILRHSRRGHDKPKGKEQGQSHRNTVDSNTSDIHSIAGD